VIHSTCYAEGTLRRELSVTSEQEARGQQLPLTQCFSQTIFAISLFPEVPTGWRKSGPPHNLIRHVNRPPQKAAATGTLNFQLLTLNRLSPLSPLLPLHPRKTSVSPIIPVHPQKQGGGGAFCEKCSAATLLFSTAVLTTVLSAIVGVPTFPFLHAIRRSQKRSGETQEHRQE
jgi:hypothetical protein